jgi:hypothetical protein
MSRSEKPLRSPADGRENATRAPAGPATYTVIGGGCYGSFYTRQLLRYADRAGGPVARIVVVDHDPACRVAREVSDPRVTVEVADWTDHLSAILPLAIERVAAGIGLPDRLVPACLAPHILCEALRRVAAPDAAHASASEARVLFDAIGTPFARVLENGSYVLSFATWICPVNCIEPATCPAIAQPLDWDMAEAVANHVRGWGARVRSCHILQCLHEAFGVGTIPISDIAREALRLEGVRGEGAGAGGGAVEYAVIATVSTCHGVAGVLRQRARPSPDPAVPGHRCAVAGP